MKYMIYSLTLHCHMFVTAHNSLYKLMYFIISWSLSFQLNIHGIDNDEREPEEQENRQQQQQRKRANEQISRELNHILAVMARPNMNVCETAASSGTGTGCYSSMSPICQPGDETGICWSSLTGVPTKERTKSAVLNNAVLLPQEKYKNPTIMEWYVSTCYIRQDILGKTLWSYQYCWKGNRQGMLSG